MGSGSHTFKAALEGPEFHWRHVNDENALDLARQETLLYTTYRAPERIAVNWKNRHRLTDKLWKESWDKYAELLTLKPVIFECDGPDEQHGFRFPKRENVGKDPYRLHKALDENDLDYFYSKIPKYLIDYAYDRR